jgi:glutaminyl-peptide cyclotransferase
MRPITLIAATALALLLACSHGLVKPPAFDGQRAFEYLKQQVDFGPRVPGTVASATCRTYFYEHFKELNVPVDSQAFPFFDPYSKTEIPMVNVIAHVRGKSPKSPALLYLAHYDTRPRTDYPSDTSLREKPIPGANDGASGSAILMELANEFVADTPAVDVDLLFVDGEDWGKEGDFENYLVGSKHFAATNIHGRYLFGIVIDMVGDKDQQIYREGYSEEYNYKLDDMVFGLAAKLGITTFHDSLKYTVMDDHLSLNAGGVPAIDLIDFDYPYWHSDKDTPDKCSPQSLANVGEILEYIAYNRSLWPKKL